MKKTISVRGIPAFTVGVLALAMLPCASVARAGTVAVTSTADSGPGSLRQAIADANPSDTVALSVKGTILLTSGALMINKDLDIEGPGPNKLKISGNLASRVFVILGGTVKIAAVTISDGLADGNAPVYASGGGGILNLAHLTLSEVVMSDNWAIGDKDQAPLGIPGAATGGGVGNMGTLTITASSFNGNLARGGDDSRSTTTLAGIAFGGAVGNFGSLAITGSTFSHNQAIGGDNTVGFIFSGHAIGGAIGSGGTVAAALTVNSSGFYHNQAIGGDGNRTVFPVPTALGPNKATGGAIDVTQGIGEIDGCTLEHNQALGGAGSSGASGGVAAGGAIVATAVTSPETTVTVSNCTVEHNTALGGPGGPGGDGGEAEGGGLACLSGATLTVVSTTVAHNHAQGGDGSGEDGGDGLGGGVYENAGRPAPPLAPGASTLTLKDATVRFNLALGGEASAGGSDGQGIGGGIFRLGIYSADDTTIIDKNHAITSNDNIGP